MGVRGDGSLRWKRGNMQCGFDRVVADVEIACALESITVTSTKPAQTVTTRGSAHQSDRGQGSAAVTGGQAGLGAAQFLWAYTQEGCRW